MDTRAALTPRNSATPGTTANEAAVLEAIRATPFGTVEIVLHQSRIVQIVRTEKVRLADDEARGC
jgi:hypothetical protein